ncbi:MAG: dienelactone hydrolase family protein [Azospirillaceae bacterium]
MPLNSTQTLTAADGHTLSAFQSLPDGPARGGLVVVQEIFGLNDHIRSVAEGFALDGYAVLAPALFDRIAPGIALGYTSEDVARGRELRGQVGWDQAVADVGAAIHGVAGWGKVGVVGYCWGGSLAWLAATRLEPAAAVCYYGGQIADFCEEAPLCPVQMHFGEADPMIPADAVSRVRDAQPGVEIHSYAEAGHGFNCEARADFAPNAAATARERTLAFLAARVG